MRDIKALEAAARAAFDAWWNNRGAGAEVSWLSTKHQWIHQQRAAISSYEAARETDPSRWPDAHRLDLIPEPKRSRVAKECRSVAGESKPCVDRGFACYRCQERASLAAAPPPEQEPRP